MMTLDPNDSFFQEDNNSHSHDDDLKNTKDTALYKDTMALLKRKMCTAHDLLEECNYKVKEKDLELHESKLDKEKLFNKYNSASEKLTRLELSNRDYEKSRNDYKSKYDKQKLELDEKKKHIEQLEFKIKEMEKDSSRLKDEIKKVQQESKISKSIAKKATKNQASQANCIQQQDASVNTDFKKSSFKKPHLKDKSTITDEVNNRERDPFLVCSKCENRVGVPPFKQILKIMSTPPPLLTNQLSPPCSPRSIPSSSRHSESIASNTLDQYFHENLESSCFDRRAIEKSRMTNEESNRPSFMLIDKLTRKINNLERLIKKKKQKQKLDKCCHQMCSPSKNIKFVVQLPNEEKYFEYANQHRHKQIQLKRLNKKKMRVKSKKKINNREWHVENDIDTQGTKSTLQHGTEQSEKKYKSLIPINETDLFKSPAIIVSNSTSKDQVIVDSSTSKSMQTPRTESLSTLDTKTHKVIVNLTKKDLDFDDENENESNLQSSVSSPVLEHTRYHKNGVTEAEQSMDSDGGKVFKTTYNESNLSLNVVKEVNDDKTVDLNSKNFSNTKESDMNNVINIENMNEACEIIEKREVDLDETASKVNSELESQENCKEIESTQLDIRRISISSAISSENDEFSSTTIHTLTDEDSHLDIINPNKSEQNSLQEIDSITEANILRSNDEMYSSVAEKVEVINSPRSRRSSIIKNTMENQMNLDNEISESIEENEDQSSDDSINFRCPAAMGNKRAKSSNVIESDCSSEDNLEDSNKNDRRKKLIAKRKKLITKIRNLKKTSKNSITSNIPTVKKAEPRDDITPTYIPTKKQRVAHIPKDTSEVKETTPAEDLSQVLEDTCEIRKTESKDVSSKSKVPNKVKRAKQTKDLPCKTKKSKLMENFESENNDEEQSTTLNVAKLEGISAGAESLERVRAVEDLEIKVETNCKEYSQDESNHVEKDKIEITGENSILTLLSSQTTMRKTESTENCLGAHDSEVPSNMAKDEVAHDDEAVDDSKMDCSVVSEDQERIPARKLRLRKAVVERPARRISSRLRENNPSPVKSDTDVCSTSSDSKKTQNKKKSTKQAIFQKFDSTNSSLANTTILSHLNDFLLETNTENKQENFQHLKKHDKPIREQLSLLMKSEPLTTDILLQVSDNLLNITKFDVVALVLVEYATTEYLEDTKCDTTYTPPAPPMTKFEQKFVTLIMHMQERQPELVDAVERGIQYKLFRLGKSQEVQVVERLFRILVVLSKIKKDREKVRMLFCDALYCFNSRAINIIYITLSCWSEVFPKHDSNNDILIKTIVYIIMSANVNRPFSKLMPLKRLLTDYYGYPNCGAGFRIENFKVELMNNLKENVPGINTAILLLCKSKGAEWTLENVIKGLKEMIVKQAHPSMYDALTLLGNLLRPFSSDNLKKSLEEITDQLCDVLSGETGLHDLEEGIVSCLLSIGGKFAFKREKIARHVFKWNSNQELRFTTKEKLNSFLKSHNPGWWRKFIQQNFPVTEQR